MNNKATEIYKPTLFLGSSSEASALLGIMIPLLSRYFKVIPWNEGFFQAGNITLVQLIKSIPEYDYAVMLFTPDDQVKSRGVDYLIARDNVEFETGLFMSALGISNVFIIEGYVKALAIKKMSDLGGLNIFPLKLPLKNGKPNYLSSLLPDQLKKICADIVKISKTHRNDIHVRDFKNSYFESQRILKTIVQNKDLEFELPILKWRIDTELGKINNIKNGTWTILADTTISYLRLVFRKILETLRSGDEYCTVTNLKFWSDKYFNRGEFITANQHARQKGIIIRRIMLINENDLKKRAIKKELTKILLDFHGNQIADDLSFKIYNESINYDTFDHVPFVTIKREKDNACNYLTLLPTITDGVQPKIDVIFKNGHEHHDNCIKFFNECKKKSISLYKMAALINLKLK